MGLTAFNLRQYDARLGRWQTPDPYGQHHSPYLAMSNNPVLFMDADGGYDYNSREYYEQSMGEMEEWNRSTKMDEDGNTAASRGAGGYDPTGRARGDLAMMDAFIRKHMTQFVRTETKRVGGGAHFDTDSGNPRYWTKTKTRTYIDWAAVQAEYSTAMAAQHQGTAQSQAHSTTDTVLGHVKTGLDIVSFIPGAGTVTGLLSAGISAYQGDWGGVAEGLVSAVPFGKVVATGAKVASAAFKAIDAAGDARRLAGAMPILAGRQSAKAHGTTSVYQSVQNGTTSYVGITDDIARRGAEHLRSKGIIIEKIPGLSNLARSDARAVEQVLIELHGLGKNGGTLMNRINSISRSNPDYGAAIRRGAELLQKAGYKGF